MYCPQKTVVTREYCKSFQEYLTLVKYYLKRYKDNPNYKTYVCKDKKSLVIEGIGNHRFLY